MAQYSLVVIVALAPVVIANGAKICPNRHFQLSWFPVTGTLKRTSI